MLRAGSMRHFAGSVTNLRCAFPFLFFSAPVPLMPRRYTPPLTTHVCSDAHANSAACRPRAACERADAGEGRADGQHGRGRAGSPRLSGAQAAAAAAGNPEPRNHAPRPPHPAANHPVTIAVHVYGPARLTANYSKRLL